MSRLSLGLLCIGPGPRAPRDVPGLLELVHAVQGEVPLFGVCLGLQAIVLDRGGDIGRAIAPVHGKVREVFHDEDHLFADLPSPMRCMRYHSLVARDTGDLDVTARSGEGEVMAVCDRARRVFAVQFHPESIGTEGGLELLANALKITGLNACVPPARPGGIPRASHA